MILIKDRHLLLRLHRYCASTLTGNMILIKDRHRSLNLTTFLSLFEGNMILIKDQHEGLIPKSVK